MATHFPACPRKTPTKNKNITHNKSDVNILVILQFLKQLH